LEGIDHVIIETLSRNFTWRYSE